VATQTSATMQKTISKSMRIGLFIPCFIDLIYPEVGIAALELLEKFGLNVEYPLDQTCCGQPMSNSGDEVNSAPAEHLFVETFPWAEFHHSVALHNSCSSVRGLGIAKPSEIMGVPFDKTADLLTKVKGLVLVPVDRPDDCCGFGGTFCVTDEAVSARMGLEKAHDHLRHGAEYVVSPDMSCLMHQQGIARRAGLDLKYVHLAQVLNGGPFQ
jgi:L-lactate dehydrogenase complex protein LldE